MSTPTELLKGLELEALVAVRLRSLGAEYEWRNESGETNSWPDFYVHGHPLDAKGSDQYEGSMYLGADNLYWDRVRHTERGGVWYVLNTLVVVDFEQALACAEQTWTCGKPGLKIRPKNATPLGDWVEERRNDEGSDRRRGDLVFEAPGQPPELLASRHAFGVATC